MARLNKFLVLLVLILAAGYSLQLYVPETTVEVNYSNAIDIPITVYNDGNSLERVSVSVSGSFGDVFIYPTTFKIAPGENKTITASVMPSDIGTFWYKVELKRYNENKDVWEDVQVKNLFVKVVGKKQNVSKEQEKEKVLLIQTDKFAVLPGDNVLLKISVSKDALPALGEITLKQGNKDLYTQGFQQNTLVKEVLFKLPDNLAPGSYLVEVNIPGYATNYTRLKVQELKKLDISKSVERKFLGERVLIYASNLGNVEDIARFELKVPFYKKFLMNFDGNYTITREGKDYKIIWKTIVEPGEKILLATYSLDYTPILAIVLVVLIGLLTILFRKHGVIVKKEVEDLGWEEGIGNVFKVVITLKNATDSPLENIKVVENLPLIARPIDYIVRPPTMIESTKDGYRMIWNIGRLEPGEEIILAYKLSLSFGVIGELKLKDPEVYY